MIFGIWRKIEEFFLIEYMHQKGFILARKLSEDCKALCNYNFQKDPMLYSVLMLDK